MKQLLTQAIENWKTTLSGMLTTLVVGGAYLTTSPPPGFTSKEMGWGTFVVGLGKIYLAIIQKDAK